MRVLGLTGSIGMGKSATAGLFRQAGVPVHDADASVHALYAGDAATPIEAAFPGVVRDGVVDRRRLGPIVLADPARLTELEAIVHPLVRREEEIFLRRTEDAGHALAVLDVPLLFETGGEGRCDAVVVVTAPPEVQRERVMARPGMTEATFEAILAKQMADGEKRARADFVVETGFGFPHAAAQVAAIVAAMATRPIRRAPRQEDGAGTPS